MKIRIVGSAAGGGFPQWNCNCPNCGALKNGKIQAQARTQSSIAISDDKGLSWVLVNASPDIRAQLLASTCLQRQEKIRDTALEAIILVDSQLDHTCGLLLLREGKKLNIYCTPAVYEDLTGGFPVINILEHYCKTQHHAIDVENNATFVVPNLSDISFTAIPLDGKAPPYSPHRLHPQKGDNIALFIQDNNSKRSLFYAPGLANVNDQIKQWMQKSDLLLIDGTFWSEDEMLHHEISTKTAQDMGHIPQSGEQGMLSILKAFPDKRKMLIHINNTNPILNENSVEYQQIANMNVEVAQDNLEIIL